MCMCECRTHACLVRYFFRKNHQMKFICVEIGHIINVQSCFQIIHSQLRYLHLSTHSPAKHVWVSREGVQEVVFFTLTSHEYEMRPACQQRTLTFVSLIHLIYVYTSNTYSTQHICIYLSMCAVQVIIFSSVQFKFTTPWHEWDKFCHIFTVCIIVQVGQWCHKVATE